jgi:hypothetical protein
LRNLLDSTPVEEEKKPKSEEKEEEEDLNYYPNFKKELYLYLIYDTQAY